MSGDSNSRAPYQLAWLAWLGELWLSSSSLVSRVRQKPCRLTRGTHLNIGARWDELNGARERSSGFAGLLAGVTPAELSS